jgi:hypothetical protein
MDSNASTDSNHGEPMFVKAAFPEFGAELQIEGFAPVQAFGSVRGRELYFRARHSTWTFEIADHLGNLPSDGEAAADAFYREATFPNAGSMPKATAIQIIKQCLEDYTQKKA